MSENVLFRGKTEAELFEFLTLEGELIVALDGYSPAFKRVLLANLKELATLPFQFQMLLLEELNKTFTDRIGTLKTVLEADLAAEKAVPE